jgi:hypothetical protein
MPAPPGMAVPGMAVPLAPPSSLSADTVSAGVSGLSLTDGGWNDDLVLPPHPVPWNSALNHPTGQCEDPAPPFWPNPPP